MLFLETDNHVKHTNCTPNKQKPTTVSLFLNSNSELKMLKDIMESFIDRGESTLLINKFTNKSSNDQYVHMYIDGFWLNNYQNILHFIRGWDNGEQLQEPISFHMVMWDSSWQEDSSFHFKHLEPTIEKNPPKPQLPRSCCWWRRGWGWWGASNVSLQEVVKAEDHTPADGRVHVDETI